MAGGRPKAGLVRVMVGLEQELLDGLDVIAGEGQRSRFIRDAVAEYLERRSGGSVQRIAASSGSVRVRSVASDAERSALAAVLSRVPQKGAV